MGELTQSFAQVTNAINQTKQQNLNRDVAQANFSFKQQANDLANRQFEAQQVQQQRDNLIENADKSLNFYTTVGELLPPDRRQELFQETSNQYKRAGLIPEGMAFDFESADEASNSVLERTIRGDVQGAQEEVQRFKMSGFKPVVDAALPRIQADAAIAERAGKYKNIIDLRSKGKAVSESEWAGIQERDPERARQMQENHQVFSDSAIQAADVRSTELDYWRKVPPEVLNDIINIKRIADIGGVVSSPDMQKQVAASQYQALATLAANEEAAGNVVPDSLVNAMNVQLATMGVGEKIPVENEQARLERRRLKAQEAEIRSRISSRTIENSRIIAQTNVLKATVPKIAQTIENMKATQGNTEARTALFKNQLEADQRKMQAIAPRLIQARDELAAQGQEIYDQLEATAHDRNMDPMEREKLYDQLEANAKATDDLNAQIDFAEAVGPELFLSYENLGARMQEMELRRTKNDDSLNSLERQRQSLVAAQTEGKLQKTQQDQATFQQEQDAIKVAQEGIRRGVNFDDPQAVQGLADELGANAPMNLIRKNAALPDTIKADGGADGGFSAPITLPGGAEGTIRVKPDNASPTGFSAVEIPTPGGKPGETTTLMSKKGPLVNIGDKPLTPEQAGRMSAAALALDEVGEAARAIIGPDGEIDRGTLFESFLGLPFSKGRQFNQVIEDAVAAKLRMETGAAANKDEVVSIARRFTPHSADSDDAIVGKVTRFTRFLQGALNAADPTGALQERVRGEPTIPFNTRFEQLRREAEISDRPFNKQEAFAQMKREGYQ